MTGLVEIPLVAHPVRNNSYLIYALIAVVVVVAIVGAVLAMRRRKK